VSLLENTNFVCRDIQKEAVICAESSNQVSFVVLSRRLV